MNLASMQRRKKSQANHSRINRLMRGTALACVLAAAAVMPLPGGLVAAAQAQDSIDEINRLVDARQFDAAIEAIERLQASGDIDAATYMKLAEIYLEQGAGIAAEAAIERARRLGADYARTAVPFAKTQLLQNKYADALGALRGVNIPVAQRAAASVVAADAHFAMRDYDEARRNYELAWDTDKDNFQAYLGVARLELESGRFEEAALLAAEARRLAPENTMVRYTEGLIARYRGDLEAAEGHFVAAQQLFDGNVLANIELAAMRIDQGELDEAQSYLDAIYDVAPQHPMAQYLSGAILAAKGQYAEADVLFNASRSVTENYLPAIYTRGMVAFQLAKYDTAIELLTTILDARPNNLPVRLALAISYVRRKQHQGALNVLGPVLNDETTDANILSVAATAAIGLGDTELGEALYARLAATGTDTVSAADVQTKLALAKFVAGQRGEALSSLIQTTSNVGANLRSLAILAGMQMRDKDLDGAEATIAKMIDTAPDRALGYNMRGSLEYSKGQYQQALRSFDAAVSRNPDYYTAIRNKALARIRLQDLAGAETDLKRLLELTPNDARAKAMLGRVLLRRDKPAEAVDYFNDAVRAIPGSVDIWADYSEALAGAGQTAEAITQAKDTAVMGEDRPDVLKRMGLLLLGLNEARVAVRPLSRYVAFYPDSGEAHLMHGRALLAMGLYTGAKLSFVRASQAESDVPQAETLAWYLFACDALAEKFDEALARRGDLASDRRPNDISASVVGDLLLSAGQLQDAVDAYRASMRLSDAAALTIGLARALDGLGDHQAAIEALQDFVRRNPTSRQGRLALGQMLETDGRIVQAAEQYEAVLRGGVADAVVAARLANAYLLTGNRRSVPLAERAFLIRPEDPFILDTYGWIMLQAARDTSAAIDALEKAVRRSPGTAQYRFHLGMAYLARGRRDDAVEAFEQALQLDPTFPDAAEAQRQLNLLN